MREELVKDDLLLTRKYGLLPDPNFNEAQARATIDRTIAKAEKRREEKLKFFHETMGERADAIAMFLKHVDAGKNNDVDAYFGKKELARLRGEDILTQLKADLSLLTHGPKK